MHGVSAFDCCYPTNNGKYGPQSREHPLVAPVSNGWLTLQFSRLRSLSQTDQCLV
jgi:hypothetical protein